MLGWIVIDPIADDAMMRLICGRMIERGKWVEDPSGFVVHPSKKVAMASLKKKRKEVYDAVPVEVETPWMEPQPDGGQVGKARFIRFFTQDQARHQAAAVKELPVWGDES